jgi:hypothetical protein
MRRLLLSLCIVLFTIQLNSQGLFTKELRWTPNDSIVTKIFQDKNHIINWGYNQLPFSSVDSVSILIKDCNIFIVLVTGCSGLPCWRIFVFKEKIEHWLLITSSDARLTENIEIQVDNNQEKIIFKTKSKQIGELPFNALIFGFHNDE